MGSESGRTAYACALTVIASLTGCQDMPPIPQEVMDQRQRFIMSTVLAYPRDVPACTNPATPRGVRDGREWRYGCFCGGGYPNLSGPDEATTLSLYFSVRPKDDIDKACRDHDICFIKFRHGDGACTQLLGRELGSLFDAYISNRDRVAGDKTAMALLRKCTQTILDIQFVFSTAFAPYEYETTGDRIHGTFARWVFATPVLGLATFFSTFGDIDYPGPTELCNRPGL